MSSASNNKRSRTDSGVSGDKRQRLSGDDSEILELEESEALIEQVDGDDTKCRNGCIYLITNPINGKVYVGQTLNYKNRMTNHEYSGNNPKQYFSRAIHKYGWENFTKDTLIDDVPEEDLDNLEINYIAFYNSFGPGGYNCTIGGGGASGYKLTEDQRQALVKRNTKNHDIEGGGSVSFCKTINKWRVRGQRVENKRPSIGFYLTKEKALKALKSNNTKGDPVLSDRSKRESGTGSVSKDGNKFRAAYQNIKIGSYNTEEKANKAIYLFKTTGKRIPSDLTMRKSGTGSIRKSKSGRFTAVYKNKNVGTFDTNEEAEQALKIHIENL